MISRMKCWIGLVAWTLVTAQRLGVCHADAVAAQVTSVLAEARAAIAASSVEWDEAPWKELTERAEAMMDEEQKNDTQQEVLQETLQRVLDKYQRQQWDSLTMALVEVHEKESETRRQLEAYLQDSVPMEEAEALLRPSKILGESEVALAEWVRDIMSEELDTFFKEATQRLLQEAKAQEVGVQGSNENVAELHCIPADVAAQQVQQALARYKLDGIGMQDLAQELSAAVVHEMTSPTYTPAPETRAIGESIWQKFIPEDWEELLPTGWQEWEIPTRLVPASLLHTLGRTGADTAPAQAIFDANTNPGSCWPIGGASGHVTLRFPQPFSVSAVTLDHVSAMLQGDRSSAPKRAKVWGYPPCRGDCNGVGFDTTDRFLLAEIEYDLEGPSVQTFGISSDAGVVDSVSCSTTMECGPDEATPVVDKMEAPAFDMSSEQVAGVRLEILENHGNADYTCIYRFRVHGEVIEEKP